MANNSLIERAAGEICDLLYEGKEDNFEPFQAVCAVLRGYKKQIENDLLSVGRLEIVLIGKKKARARHKEECGKSFDHNSYGAGYDDGEIGMLEDLISDLKDTDM